MPPWNAVSLRKRNDVPQGITPPRLACAIVLRHLDIAALEGIMMRLGMVKTSDNFVYASSSESAYLHI